MIKFGLLLLLTVVLNADDSVRDAQYQEANYNKNEIEILTDKYYTVWHRTQKTLNRYKCFIKYAESTGHDFPDHIKEEIQVEDTYHRPSEYEMRRLKTKEEVESLINHNTKELDWLYHHFSPLSQTIRKLKQRVTKIIHYVQENFDVTADDYTFDVHDDNLTFRRLDEEEGDGSWKKIERNMNDTSHLMTEFHDMDHYSRLNQKRFNELMRVAKQNESITDDALDCIPVDLLQARYTHANEVYQVALGNSIKDENKRMQEELKRNRKQIIRLFNHVEHLEHANWDRYYSLHHWAEEHPMWHPHYWDPFTHTDVPNGEYIEEEPVATLP